MFNMEVIPLASLIPKEEIIELKSAAAVKAVADDALSIIEEQQVAALINTAANTGQHRAIWQHELSDELKKTLEAQGYKITRRMHSANPDFVWEIGGF